MEKLNKILSFLFLFFIVFGVVNADGEKSFSALEPGDFKNKITQENTIVIDIRSPYEISFGKITSDALEINYYEENFLEELDKLNKNKTYLIYCASGHRSMDTKNKMKELGFQSVYDLKGGIASWTDKLFKNLDKNKILEEYKGKPTVILFASTSCPHCRDDVPEIEEKIFDEVGDKINVIINVVNGEGGERFKTKIEQKADSSIDYKTLTGEECGYVPSWIVLDKDGSVVDKSCGNIKKTEGIITRLKDLGVSFDKQKLENKKTNEKDENLWIYILISIGILGGGYWVFKK